GLRAAPRASGPRRRDALHLDRARRDPVALRPHRRHLRRSPPPRARRRGGRSRVARPADGGCRGGRTIDAARLRTAVLSLSASTAIAPLALAPSLGVIAVP